MSSPSSCIWRRAHAASHSFRCSSRKHFHSSCNLNVPFQIGERVIGRKFGSKNLTDVAFLTSPLVVGNRIDVSNGTILHDDIIGKEERELVFSSSKTSFRLHRPNLDEYIRLTPRAVTPIYSNHASNIISVLDLHPDYSQDPPIEILEAGTGHGALTLHLARAIHAANYKYKEMLDEHRAAPHQISEPDPSLRKAIIHTLDINPQRTATARKLIDGFRGGMYSHNINFYSMDVPDWIQGQLERRGGQPFLNHAIFDLPGSERILSSLGPAMQPGATVAMFCPSITQIVDCVGKIKDSHLPFIDHEIFELSGMTGVGRQWEVAYTARQERRVAKRTANTATSRLERLSAEERNLAAFLNNQTTEVSSEKIDQSEDAELDGASEIKDATEPGMYRPAPPLVICRPKFGERVTAGGFLGVWKKKASFNVA